MDQIKICILGFFTENTPDPATIARKCEALGFDAGDLELVPSNIRSIVLHHWPHMEWVELYTDGVETPWSA